MKIRFVSLLLRHEDDLEEAMQNRTEPSSRPIREE